MGKGKDGERKKKRRENKNCREVWNGERQERFRKKAGVRLKEKEIEEEWELCDKEEAGKEGIKGV